jgi:quercetin dioxygenase-like cupin family protein
MNQSSAFVKTEDYAWEAAGDGVKRKILGYDSGLMMVHVRFTKGAIGYVHKHSHRQVTFVEQGSFEVQIERVKTILRKGDSFIVPPDVEHGVVALEDGDLLDVFTPAREDFLASAKLK